ARLQLGEPAATALQGRLGPVRRPAVGPFDARHVVARDGRGPRAPGPEIAGQADEGVPLSAGRHEEEERGQRRGAGSHGGPTVTPPPLSFIDALNAASSFLTTSAHAAFAAPSRCRRVSWTSLCWLVGRKSAEEAATLLASPQSWP